MVEKTTEAGQLSWRLPSYAAIIEIVIFIPIAISHPDTMFFVGIFLVIPALLIASIVLIVLFVRSVLGLGLGRVHPLSILATLAILWVIPTSLIFYERKHPFALHETARWLAASNVYKGKVFAQPTSNGEFRHIEWDGSGFAGVANQTVYLVFDPSDTLSAAVKSHRADKFDGIPCRVRSVQRLESHWYSVVFYTDQDWGHCN
jgi:hypothetical protein